MRLGMTLPQFGNHSDITQVSTVAAQAESLGFESLWVGERAHAPISPKAPYPSGDGSMPEQMRRCHDPLLILALAAQATSTPLLGTSTFSAPLRAPIEVARGFAGLDQLSGGRMIAGFGLSWQPDEYEAAGVPWAERGARLDECLDILEKLWGEDPVRHQGRFYDISPGWFQPKPVQPKLPIYLGGFSPVAFRRVGSRADGWLGVAMPPDMLRQVLAGINGFAEAAGRGPVATALRINLRLQDTPTDMPGVGPVEQLVDYLHEVSEIGIADAFIELHFTTETITDFLHQAEKIRTAYP